MSSGDAQSAAYLFGREALGTTFVCFAHLLLRHARRQACHRLAFVARDGDLLMRTVAQLPPSSDDEKRPQLAYLYLSRRATTLPARRRIDAAALAEASAERAGTGSVREVLEYLGLSANAVAPALAGLGIDPLLPARSERLLTSLAEDPTFQATVSCERQRQRALLESYLTQEGIGSSASTMLVDIGWRGSILRNLNHAFASSPDFQLPAAAFVGLWAENGRLPVLPGVAAGLIADMRRRRNVVEGSAWYAAFLLEAVCRANEGTTLGYAGERGSIRPVLAGDSASRRSELASMGVSDAIRQGVLEYVAACGGDSRWRRASDAQLRSTAQRALFRLACFPTRDEIAVGAQLMHSEAHAANWSAPLIASDRPSPLNSPRRWLAGLASPWRMAYVKSTGGAFLVGSLLLAESLLLQLPAPARQAMTNATRRIAGIS